MIKEGGKITEEIRMIKKGASKKDEGKLDISYISSPLIESLFRVEPLFNPIGKGGIGRAIREIMAFLELPRGDRDLRPLVRAFRLVDFSYQKPFGGEEEQQIMDDQVRISEEFLTLMVKVREFGAQKYSRDNWKLGFKFHRGLNSALRHGVAYLGGQILDPESGLPHLGHMGCSLEHIIYGFKKYGVRDDDRRPPF